MSEEEKTDWESGLKGAYNASDLNRVGNAVVYVAGPTDQSWVSRSGIPEN